MHWYHGKVTPPVLTSATASRWSPDGGTLAVGSEDSFVYLYNCGDYIAKAKCAGHKGPVRVLAYKFYFGDYCTCRFCFCKLYI